MNYDKIHTVPEILNLNVLDSKKSFDQLSENEKLYAYYMYKASWAGIPIIAEQVSKESVDLIKMFVDMFKFYDIASIVNDNSDDICLSAFVNYAALVLANCGNYLSFGDTKILPRMTRDEMLYVISKYFSEYLYDYALIEHKIFSLKENEKCLGYFPDNVTTYFTSNMTESEVRMVNDFIMEKGLEGWNTTASKDDSVPPIYYVHVASIIKRSDYTHDYKGHTICIEYGNFEEHLRVIVKNLHNALCHTANETQKNMLSAYIKHFTNGDIKYHKESQKFWVTDKNPVVETNIGFIENYRDPSGIRSEFESFVSIVDKEKTKKLSKLVNNAEYFLNLLPWPKAFEKDVFNPPDFTSLDVICFVSSGIPIGINIPNYDDIRQNVGFKNVSLDNVATGMLVSKDLPNFLNAVDGELYNKYLMWASEIDVAGHELLGHGSGKLFVENRDGSCNFSKDTINPINGEIISCWYKNDETWSSKFNKLSSSYEECRAECVGLYLSNFKEMHDIFEHTDWEDVCYVSWLWMIRAGLLGLLSYNPKDNKWLQAHSQARYVIYKMLREAGLVTIVQDNKSFVINVDRSKIVTNGIPALKYFLLQLNVYKATADLENGTKLFDKYSQVDDEHIKLRAAVIDNKKNRAEMIQPTLVLEDDLTTVTYKSYEMTPQGMIQSFVDKFV